MHYFIFLFWIFRKKYVSLPRQKQMNMRQKAIIYLIIIVGIALLTGCSDSGKTYKIGVSQCSEGRWREKVNQEMLAAQTCTRKTWR